MGWLNNKVALVTGGASGLGRAIVERFLDEGAHVAILDRSRERSEEMAARLGDRIATIVGDVTSLPDNQRAVAETVKRFGGLDCLVGNAGIWDFNASIVDLPEDRIGAAFDELFGVKSKDTFSARRQHTGNSPGRAAISSSPFPTRAFTHAAAVRCTPPPSMPWSA